MDIWYIIAIIFSILILCVFLSIKNAKEMPEDFDCEIERYLKQREDKR